MEENKLPAARSLTWDERMDLVKAELDPQFWLPDGGKRMNGVWERDFVVFIMKTLFPDVDYQKMSYSKVSSLAHKCYRMTVTQEEEEKNS